MEEWLDRINWIYGMTGRPGEKNGRERHRDEVGPDEAPACAGADGRTRMSALRLRGGVQSRPSSFLTRDQGMRGLWPWAFLTRSMVRAGFDVLDGVPHLVEQANHGFFPP